MGKSYFTPGNQVVLRRIWNNNIYRVTAVTVVQDTPDLIALFWGPGYPVMSTKNPLKVSSFKTFDLHDGKWGSTYLLLLASPKAAHAVYAMWDGGHNLMEWYINLQEPLRRTAIGFDTVDYLLDITVSPDRTEWVWKDVDDFEEAVSAGMISADQARSIRSEGERAIKLVQQDSSSFYDTWMNWKPPSNWEIPNLPIDWDKV